MRSKGKSRLLRHIRYTKVTSMPFCRTLHLIVRKEKNNTMLYQANLFNQQFLIKKIWIEHNCQFFKRNALWILKKTSTIQLNYADFTYLTVSKLEVINILQFSTVKSEYRKGYIHVYFTLLIVVSISPISRGFFLWYYFR